MRTAIFGSLLLLGVIGGSEINAREINPQRAISQSTAPTIIAQQSSPTITPAKTPPQIKLLNSGTGDRQLLRFKPAVGTRQVSLMSFDQTMSMSLSGQAMPGKNTTIMLPLVNTTIEMVVTKVDDNGDIHYQFGYQGIDVIARPGMPAAMVDLMKSQMETLRNVRGDFVMSDRGLVKSGQFDLPGNLDPMVRQVLEQLSRSMNQLSFPLPEEAVGVGAKWQTSAPLSIAGINLNQSATYELVSANRNLVNLRIQVAQQAPPQLVTPPGIPISTNVKIQLKKLKTEGQGQSTLDLTKPFVQQSAMSMKSMSQMGVAGAPGVPAMEMTTETFIQMKFEPK